MALRNSTIEYSSLIYKLEKKNVPRIRQKGITDLKRKAGHGPAYKGGAMLWNAGA